MTSTMQTSTRVSPSSATTATPRQPIWKHALASAVGAAIVTTTAAAIARSAGASFAPRDDAAIPTAAFAQLTLLFSLLGAGIAAVMARKARTPRSTFVRTAVALTVLSFVPDLTVGFSAGSAVILIALHAAAAAIVVPVLAGRLARTRC